MRARKGDAAKWLRALADEAGVSVNAISLIAKGVNWAHVV